MFAEKYLFFIEIANCGSITKAADRLLISQPALSKYLSRLEASLNAELFDRKLHPLKLTNAGEVFYRYVMQGLEQEKQCKKEIEAVKNNQIETLRIGIGRWRGSCLLPQILPVFQERFPYIKIEVLEGISDLVADAMLKERIDIAVMGQFEHYYQLGSIPLRDERVLLVANHAHPAVKQIHLQKPGYSGFVHVALDQFQQEHFILTTSRQGFARVVERHFAEIGLTPQNVTRIESLNTGTYMVSQGNYFTFLPEIALHSLAFPENLTFMTFGAPMLLYPVGLTFNKSVGLTPAAKLFSKAVLTFYETNPIGFPHNTA